MARRSKGSLRSTLEGLSQAIEEVIGEVSAEVYTSVDRGLDKAAQAMEQALEAATPTETGKTKDSWDIDFKYKNVRYINYSSVNEIGSPFVNLLEFGS